MPFAATGRGLTGPPYLADVALLQLSCAIVGRHMRTMMPTIGGIAQTSIHMRPERFLARARKQR